MAAKETICNCCCTLMMRLSMPVRNTVLRGDSGQARTTSRRYLRNAISSFMTCGNARAVPHGEFRKWVWTAGGPKPRGYPIFLYTDPRSRVMSYVVPRWLQAPQERGREGV